jgi:hypothetical protein
MKTKTPPPPKKKKSVVPPPKKKELFVDKHFRELGFAVYKPDVTTA